MSSLRLPKRLVGLVNSWAEHRQARADVIAEAKADPATRARILAGVDAALVRVTDTIARQSRRIIDEPFFQAQRDMDTFLVAADQLKAISVVLTDLGVSVTDLREGFESASPHIRTARDVFAHYEDYLLGAGQKQVRRGEPVSMFYQRGDSAGTAVHMTNPDVVVNIGAALNAAAVFADGMTERVASARTHIDDSDLSQREATVEGKQ